MKYLINVAMTAVPLLIAYILDLLELEVSAFYLKALKQARRMFIVGVLTVSCIVLSIIGFAMVHIALFLYLPWSISVKAFVLLGLGLLYLLIPLGFVLRYCSSRTWVKIAQIRKK